MDAILMTGCIIGNGMLFLAAILNDEWLAAGFFAFGALICVATF